MNRARLSEKRRAEPSEDLFDRHQSLMKAPNSLTVVGSIAVVLGERDRIRHFVWTTVEFWSAPELRDQVHEFLVKCRNRRWLKIEGNRVSVPTGANDLMRKKVEPDLNPWSIGDGRGSQPTWRDVEGRIP